MARILKRRPSAALVVAMIALIVALAGTAYAGAKIGFGELSKGAKTKTQGVGPLTYVSQTNTLSVTPNEGANISVSCPRGTHVLDGGVTVSPHDPANNFVNDMGPTVTGWTANVGIFATGGGTAKITAICATSRKVSGTL